MLYNIYLFLSPRWINLRWRFWDKHAANKICDKEILAPPDYILYLFVQASARGNIVLASRLEAAVNDLGLDIQSFTNESL